MTKKDRHAGRVSETRATYRVFRRAKARRPAKQVLRELKALRKQLSGHGTDGKDAVTLVREERER